MPQAGRQEETQNQDLVGKTASVCGRTWRKANKTWHGFIALPNLIGKGFHCLTFAQTRARMLIMYRLCGGWCFVKPSYSFTSWLPISVGLWLSKLFLEILFQLFSFAAFVNGVCIFICESFFFNFQRVIYLMTVCLHACVCIMCVPDGLGSQKRVLDFLELELWLVVNYHVGTGNGM